jgi:hypothetical protein
LTKLAGDLIAKMLKVNSAERINAHEVLSILCRSSTIPGSTKIEMIPVEKNDLLKPHMILPSEFLPLMKT